MISNPFFVCFAQYNLFCFPSIFSFRCSFKRSNSLYTSIKHNIFLLSRSLIYLCAKFARFTQKKPDITALLPYTRLSDSYDLSAISYSVKYSGYSSIVFLEISPESSQMSGHKVFYIDIIWDPHHHVIIHPVMLL